MIQTPSCAAGVRGTEFSVYAGADGSALIVVDSGLVEVESEGKAVQLTSEEGVEVQPGEPPGEKFVVQRDQIDYKTWNDDKLSAMLADPVLAMERIQDRMEFYIAMERIQDRMEFYIQKVQEYDALYFEYLEKLEEERRLNTERAQKEGEDVALQYENEVIFPMSVETFNLGLNVRYFSLAALSLRRYVAGRTYLLLKAKYITDYQNTIFSEYKKVLGELLDRFEKTIAPQLVEADI
jgi:hypothetical protein